MHIVGGTVIVAEKHKMVSGQGLSDNYMIFIQAMFKDQFPHVGGLRNTLILNTARAGSSLQGQSLQAIFVGATIRLWHSLTTSTWCCAHLWQCTKESWQRY